MRLYFVRHGKAGDAASDHARPLTPQGIAQAQAAAKVLAALDIQPAHIYSSPRLRARQTADIIAAALGQTVEEREEVNFDFSVSAVRSLISALMPDDEAMFVGHNPSMSEVVEQISEASVGMKTCAIARVDIFSRDVSRGELVWLMPPKLARAISQD